VLPRTDGGAKIRGNSASCVSRSKSGRKREKELRVISRPEKVGKGASVATIQKRRQILLIQLHFERSGEGTHETKTEDEPFDGRKGVRG